MNTLESFFDHYPTIRVSKGEIIFSQGDTPRYAYAVKYGYVKVCNLTSSGEEKIVSFKTTDDLFPVSWIFSKTEQSLFFYCAHTDCVLYQVDKAAIHQQLKDDALFAKKVLNQHINAHIHSDFQIEALEQSRASLKLFYTLRHFSLTHGEQIKPHMVRLTLPITQQDLANVTGLARETIVGEISKLKKEGVVAFKNHICSIDTVKLGNKIDDEFNPGLIRN